MEGKYSKFETWNAQFVEDPKNYPEGGGEGEKVGDLTKSARDTRAREPETGGIALFLFSPLFSLTHS